MELLSQRPQYTLHQFQEYTTHLGMTNIPGSDRNSKGDSYLIDEQSKEKIDDPVDQLRYLRDLQKFHLAKVPFENLSLHYSAHKIVDLDPAALYRKIVEEGRGGYCMENNCFFGTMLRCKNYNVCSVGARVHAGEGVYGAWSHMVNIVSLPDGARFLVDVGFGHNGPTEPLLMVDGHEEASIPPATMRLVREKIPATTNPSDHLWIYQHRLNPTSDWQSMYCFTETEFLPGDYEMMNFWTSQSRKSFFTYTVMCVKSIMDKKTVQLVGTLVLVGGELKKTVGGKTEQVRKCKTEGERVRVLEEFFDIKLAEEDKQGIRRMVTALPEAVFKE